MKTVYANRNDVVHAWAHQKSTRGRAGNIFFEGPTIYSYGHHFPMARRINEELYAITYDTYSATTSRHMSQVRASIPKSAKTVYVFDPSSSAERSLDSARGKIRRLIASAAKRRKEDLAVWDLGQAIRTANDFNTYAKATGSKARIRLPKDLDPAKAKDLYRKVLDSERRERKRAELRQKKAQEQRDRELAPEIERWRNVERDRHATGLPTIPTIPHRMRIVGKSLAGLEIESSAGISTDARHGPAIWRIVQACRKHGRSYEGRRDIIGWGRLSVTPLGQVTIGCHVFSPEEVDLMAERLRTIGLLVDESPADLDAVAQERDSDNRSETLVGT